MSTPTCIKPVTSPPATLTTCSTMTKTRPPPQSMPQLTETSFQSKLSISKLLTTSLPCKPPTASCCAHFQPLPFQLLPDRPSSVQFLDQLLSPQESLATSPSSLVTSPNALSTSPHKTYLSPLLILCASLIYPTSPLLTGPHNNKTYLSPSLILRAYLQYPTSPWLAPEPSSSSSSSSSSTRSPSFTHPPPFLLL